MEAARGARFLGSGDAFDTTTETVFWVASCTKIVVTISLLQCVERGLITLDTVPTDVLPEIKTLQLLQGWTKDGAPILGSPKRLPTLREILSHQSGIGVDISELDLIKWRKYVGSTTNSQTGAIVSQTKTSLVPLMTLSKADLQYPLIFNPGEGWAYSVGMDWTAHLVRFVPSVAGGSFWRALTFEDLKIERQHHLGRIL